ncbi:MAG: hypothetical protein JWN44_6600 [Myxococcales bacterium]|nr:hypothetical protein [Myxococcales bacterium]
MLTVEPHPHLELGAFVTRFPAALGSVAVPEWVGALLALDAAAPFSADDSVRAAVRDVLRAFGYKPTGRGKPASEYLIRAVGEKALSSINLAVDMNNAVSLHSGLPVSAVDLDRVRGPLRVAVAQAGAEYVFNAGGQVIQVAGLPCLFDAEGACANAVKDAQRTKTTPETRATLSLVWGARVLGERTRRVTEWYREMVERAGGRTEEA